MKKICKVKNCNNKAQMRFNGLCNKHYVLETSSNLDIEWDRQPKKSVDDEILERLTDLRDEIKANNTLIKRIEKMTERLEVR